MSTALVATFTDTPRPSLEDLLASLQRYGYPRVAMHSGGWVCTVDLNTSVAGASSSIRSEFGMASPWDAALQCEQRVEAAIGGRK
jgi:hypothetical protein